MSDVLTVQGAAGCALACFVNATRDDGSSFERAGVVVLKLADGSPGWVSDLVYAAHDGCYPDDWKYQTVRAALEAVADDGGEDDAGFADSRVDCYTGQLVEWLGSGCGRVSLCDEAAEELGAPVPDTLVYRIMGGQYLEASRIFALVVGELREVVETWENDTDELREVGGAYDGHTVTSDSDSGL